MRRKDREVADQEKVDAIIRACHCCRIGFADGDGVYIVPMNFGYERCGEKRRFYFHGASEGRKIELVKAGRPVGFELDTNYQLREAANACGYSARFQSVIGTGIVSLVETEEEKRHALRQIMAHYTGTQAWDMPPEAVGHTAVFQLEVTSLTCKEHE